MKISRSNLWGTASPFARAIPLLLCLGFATVAQAAPEDKDKIALNFVNAEIEAVVKTVSIISGRNFVLDPRVKGTINVVSSSPIAPELAYPILVSALRLQGFAVIENNGVTKIVPEADAKTHAIPTTSRSSAPNSRIITRVFAIRSESAAQLLPILRPLVTANNAISVYPANNILVITDYADNIKRLEKVIESIERGGSENPAVFRLTHLAATDVAGLLSKLFGEGSTADPTQRAAIIADTTSNSIIVRSDNSAVLGRIRSLLKELDQSQVASGNIHVIPLKNAEAVKLAQTLRAILSGDMSSLAPPSATTGSAAITVAATTGNGHGGKSSGLASGSSIQADAATNSLIIIAPDPVINNLRGVIEALDKRRAQVFIEALIVEISAERATEVGFQWQSFLSGLSKDSEAFGGTNFAKGTTDSIVNAGSGRRGAGLTVGVMKYGSLLMLARFFETDTDANILSMPRLITLDNEEGKIVIGQNLPFVTGQYATTGSTVTPTPFQTIERRDVGISLKVKPQINEGGSIRVQISQEVSSVDARSLTGLGPVTNKRSIDSMVMVDDGGIIALGGLMEDTFSADDEKVPLLGDIPVIGNLFRYDTRKRKKSNLMVFLRPQVLRDKAANDRLTADYYDRVQDEQAKSGSSGRLMRGEDPPPQLPDNSQSLGLKAEPKLQKGSALPENRPQ